MSDITHENISDYLKGFAGAVIFTGMQWDHSDEVSGYDNAEPVNADIELSAHVLTDIYADAMAALSEVTMPRVGTLIEYAEQRDGGEEFSTWELIGHDAYLTAAHHGTGFWDRGIPQGHELTARLRHHYAPQLVRDTSSGETWYE